MYQSILVLDHALGRFKISLHHLLDQRGEINFALPSKQALRLGGRSQQEAESSASVEPKENTKDISTHSTSAGRKYCGSTLTTTLPVLTSVACSSTPEPDHLKASRSSVESTRPTEIRVLELDAECFEGQVDKLADGVRLAGRENKVFRLGLLEHKPHALDVVTR